MAGFPALNYIEVVAACFRPGGLTKDICCDRTEIAGGEFRRADSLMLYI